MTEERAHEQSIKRFWFSRSMTCSMLKMDSSALAHPLPSEGANGFRVLMHQTLKGLRWANC